MNTSDHDILIEVRAIVGTLDERTERIEKGMTGLDERTRALEEFRGRLHGYSAVLIVVSTFLGWALSYAKSLGALLFTKH